MAFTTASKLRVVVLLSARGRMMASGAGECKKAVLPGGRVAVGQKSMTKRSVEGPRIKSKWEMAKFWQAPERAHREAEPMSRLARQT